MKILKEAVALIFLCTAVGGCVKESEGNVLKIGDSIPSFTVDGPQGTFSSGNFTGEGGVLVFFASYCSTCKTVLPEMERLWKASGEGEAFAVAALSRQNVYQEDERSVAEYWENAGYTMPYYLDRDGGVYYLFASETIPRVYVIDRSRKITFMSAGDANLKASEIASELEKALDITIDL